MISRVQEEAMDMEFRAHMRHIVDNCGRKPVMEKYLPRGFRPRFWRLVLGE